MNECFEGYIYILFLFCFSFFSFRHRSLMFPLVIWNISYFCFCPKKNRTYEREREMNQISIFTMFYKNRIEKRSEKEEFLFGLLLLLLTRLWRICLFVYCNQFPFNRARRRSQWLSVWGMLLTSSKDFSEFGWRLAEWCLDSIMFCWWSRDFKLCRFSYMRTTNDILMKKFIFDLRCVHSERCYNFHHKRVVQLSYGEELQQYHVKLNGSLPMNHNCPYCQSRKENIFVIQEILIWILTVSMILIVHKPFGSSPQLCTLINDQFLNPSVDESWSRSESNVVCIPRMKKNQ